LRYNQIGQVAYAVDTGSVVFALGDVRKIADCKLQMQLTIKTRVRVPQSLMAPAPGYTTGLPAETPLVRIAFPVPHDS
jgi:hypothetical protein